MRICKPGDDYGVAWAEGGFSRCFLDLTGSITCTGLLLLLGFTAIVFRKKDDKRQPRRSWCFALSTVLVVQLTAAVFMALSYAADLVVKGVLGARGDQLYGSTLVADGLGIVAWAFAAFLLTKEGKLVLLRRAHGYTLVFFWTLSALWLCLQVVGWSNPSWWWRLKSSADIADLVFFVARAAILTTVLTLGVVVPLFRRPTSYTLLVDAGDESGDEGRKETAAVAASKAAAAAAAIATGTDPRSGSFIRSNVEGANASTFSDFWRKTKIIFPYVWPKGHYMLQLRVLVCLLLLGMGRVVNVYVPVFYKIITDDLTTYSLPSNSTPTPIPSPPTVSPPSVKLPTNLVLYIVGYVMLRFLQGGSVGTMGFLNNYRSYLWIPVQQYTTRAMQVNLYHHLHDLSLRWHLGRKTGEVLGVMDRGTSSVNSLLNYVLFSVAPTFVDIGIAIIYFVVAFDVWFGLITFVTMAAYLLATIHITEWRTKYRREMNEKDNETRTKAVDSLLNFETVKYYGAEGFEVDRLNAAILGYQSAEWKSLASVNVLNSAQNVIITAGLLGGSLLCAYRVLQQTLTIGDFILFNTYIIQLYSPLNYFGTYYQLIQQAFIDMENMFDLLDVEKEIKDAPDAHPLVISGGRVEFRNVYFHYLPEKPILRNVTFSMDPGQTFALVGPSGAGKSTIVRLLFRFYEVNEGSILIDGQDLRMVQQASLRQSIGVVPQDTVLFNDTIRYNVRYGKVNAEDEEVEEAASHADIHQKILTFPLRYETVVGERGLKLSGGEKQRVAIARTILKAPSIILLDEATSALDTATERNIQAALMEVCRNRTTIIVAHRLSTIIHADQILVLKDGEICERGTHRTLLEQGGIYATMWNNQQQSLDKGAEQMSAEQ